MTLKEIAVMRRNYHVRRRMRVIIGNVAEQEDDKKPLCFIKRIKRNKKHEETVSQKLEVMKKCQGILKKEEKIWCPLIRGGYDEGKEC